MSIQGSARLLVALVAAATLATSAPLLAQSSEPPPRAQEVTVPVGASQGRQELRVPIPRHPLESSKTRRIRVVLVSANEVGLPVVAASAPGSSVVTSHGGGMTRPLAPGSDSAARRPGNSLFDRLVTPGADPGPSVAGLEDTQRRPLTVESNGMPLDRAVTAADPVAGAPVQASAGGRPVVRMVSGGSGRIHVLPAPDASWPTATTSGAPGGRGSGIDGVRQTIPAPGYRAGEPAIVRTPAGEEVYRIGAGDVLDVFVWRNPDLSRQLPVRPDGLISLPLVGEVQAAGLSAEELQARLATRLSDYVQQPTVTVTVTEIRSLVIYVLGNVNSPGTVVMERNLTALQAIAMAGGLNEFADRNDIVVLRTDAAGVQHRLEFRYDDVVEGKNLGSNLLLRAGDVIYVP